MLFRPKTEVINSPHTSARLPMPALPFPEGAGHNASF
jgi:hypothetical protein